MKEVAQKFEDDVAVHITDATQEDRDKLEKAIEEGDHADAVEVAHVRPAEKKV